MPTYARVRIAYYNIQEHQATFDTYARRIFLLSISLYLRAVDAFFSSPPPLIRYYAKRHTPSQLKIFLTATAYHRP